MINFVAKKNTKAAIKELFNEVRELIKEYTKKEDIPPAYKGDTIKLAK